MPSYNLAELKRANQKATIREVLSRLYPLGSNKIEKGEKIGTGGQGMKGVKSHLEDSSPLNLTLSDTACDMWPLPPTIIVEFSELKMTQRLLILTFPLELLLPYPYKLLYSPNLKRLLQMSHFPAAPSCLSLLEVLAPGTKKQNSQLANKYMDIFFFIFREV